MMISNASFKATSDNIAVVVKEFTLRKKSEFFADRYSEPYIVSMAIDENGANNPTLDFNALPFPRVRKGEKVSFDGQGHLIYGPANPGAFLAYAILFMESDNDIRRLGERIETIVQSEAVQIGAKALLAAQPTYGTAITIIQKLTELLTAQLQRNRDDFLFRRTGLLLRDTKPPYDILRTYESENDFINTQTAIVPLQQSNGIGEQTKKVELT